MTMHATASSGDAPTRDAMREEEALRAAAGIESG